MVDSVEGTYRVDRHCRRCCPLAADSSTELRRSVSSRSGNYVSDTSQQDETQARRVRWNDIRIVGPTLVLALFMAVLVNPQFASSQQSVGADLQRCNDFAFASQGAVALPAPECCNVIVNVIAVLPSCEEPTPVPPTVTLVPPRKQVTIPGPIVGPTWLGPIAPTSSTGLITLKVPPLLGIFFGQTNEVVVTNATGDIVYKGNLATNRLMVLSAPRAGGSGNYTVQTTLITGPKYTEVVSVTG